MPFISNIKAQNILSFDASGIDLPLGDLNVLVGPNGSGKSNFLELFSLLRSTPRSQEEVTNNMQGVIRRGGGITEWIWKGAPKSEALIEVLFPNFKVQTIRHRIAFHAD